MLNIFTSHSSLFALLSAVCDKSSPIRDKVNTIFFEVMLWNFIGFISVIRR